MRINDREMKPFKVVADFEPRGDQPAAIERLAQGASQGLKHQTLLGVTGSGKGSVVHAIQTYVVLMNHTPDALLLWQRFQVAFHEALLEEVGRDFVPLVHNRHRVLLV